MKAILLANTDKRRGVLTSSDNGKHEHLLSTLNAPLYTAPSEPVVVTVPFVSMV